LLGPYAPKPSAAQAATLSITVVPIDRRGRYRVYLGPRLLVAGTRTPLLDCARELIRLGADPDAIVVMRHAGASHDALRARLGTAAGLTVDEDRCRFRPVRGRDTASPVRQTVRAYAGISHARAHGRAAA
jgi:hypothetical protein